MKLTVAYSPCPNDTFMFYALATGKLSLQGHDIEVHLDDVETLNQQALMGRYDFTKLSFHAYLRVRDRYLLLRAGAALGFGCGPLVVARHDIRRPDLKGLRVAIPGDMTTAHLLFRLWGPETSQKVFVPYDRILEMVKRGDADCGVIIHESRFVYERAGLRLLVDLGEWWDKKTGLPIPLGCIAGKKILPKSTIQNFDAALRQSILCAREAPKEALGYAKQFARELDYDILSKHVETFVTESSLELGKDGMAAVQKLEEMAEAVGVME